jgi:hemolysin D
VIETPASPIARGLASVIILFFLVALLWACFGTVDIIATATGKIVSSERTQTIQPFETGVVRAIHVQDGEQVKTGDVLIEIDRTINAADRDRLQSEWRQSQLDAARYQAAVADIKGEGAGLQIPPDAPADLVALQQSLLARQLDEIHAKLGSLDQQILQSQGSQAATVGTIQKLQQSIPLLKQRDKIRQELASKGYGSKLDALNSEQDLIEHQRELDSQKGHLSEASAAVASLREQRRQAEAEFLRDNLDKQAEAAQKATDLQNQLVQATEKTNLQTITAPVDGTVQQLAVHTEGGVVTPAQTLMEIVPKGSPLEINAMIPNRDIGFVNAGQEVVVKIDTFNFTQYGLLSGKVISISQDAIMQSDSGSSDSTHVPSQKNLDNNTDSNSEPKGQELVYAARIALDQTEMQIDNKTIPLMPGMAVTAEIRTGSRPVIEYLLSPLARHKQEAFRER